MRILDFMLLSYLIMETSPRQGSKPRPIVFGSVLFGFLVLVLVLFCFFFHLPQVLFFPSHSVGEMLKTSTGFSPVIHQS